MNMENIILNFIGSFAGFVIFIGILFIIWIVVTTISVWRLFKKAGKGGWESIIPFYNYWILVEISGLQWWWFLLVFANIIVSFIGLGILVPFANFVSFAASFNCFYNIAKKFNKDTEYAVFTGIFPMIFILILGFSKKDIYDSNVLVSENGVFDSLFKNKEDKNTYTNNNFMFCGNCGRKVTKDNKFCPDCGKKL